MLLLTIIIGFLFGFLGSIPLAGPISVMIVARGLDGRFASGIGLAIGAAVAEGIYAFLSFLGFSTLLKDMPWVLKASRGLAAVVLLILGVQFLRWLPKLPRPDSPGDTQKGLALGFVITALNPTLLATWSVATATLFSAQIIDFRPELSFPFALATTFGIILWFLILLRVVRRVSSTASPSMGWLVVTVKAMGGFLLVVATWFCWQFFRDF